MVSTLGLFSSGASQKELAVVSRQLGMSLNSGIDVVRAVDMAQRKSRGPMQRVLGQLLDDVKSGSDITSSLESQGNFFPELFVNMVNVGEQAGALPEVLRSLSEHYENNIRLRKEFLSQITMPMIQLALAIVVIAALLLILGFVASVTGNEVDVFGLGLVGMKGATVWLGGWAMLFATLFIGYRMIRTSVSGLSVVHRFLLSIPVVGGCMQSFAIARFSWAFHLTQNAGMPIDESLEASLKATSNGAFMAASSQIISDVREGDSLTDALMASRLFPEEFIQICYVAETSGTVPEALDRLSPQFEDDARRSLQALTALFGWMIWGAVATVIIVIVFTIALWYISMINELLKDI